MPDTTGWIRLFQPDLSDAVLESTGSWTMDSEKHKFDRPLKNQAKSGPIGFQGIHTQNGISVEYRLGHQGRED